jgi:hypothetical protein
MAKLKGMSLPLETVVLLILAAVVLAALLGFFLGTFTPAQSKIDILKKQSSLCQQIFSADPACDASKPGVAALANKLKSEVCGKPTDGPICSSKGSSDPYCIKGCCSIFCPS